MNVIVFLPLIAFFANLIMCCYILYSGIESKIKKLYGLFSFSVAIWSLGDFISFASATYEIALFWNHLTLIGACLTSAFLLHFFILFTKNKFIEKKINLILLYLPALFFIFIRLTTNLISKSAEPAWWGYDIIRGTLYIPYTLYLVGCIIVGFLLCFRYSLKSTSAKEKNQIKLLITAVAVPLAGGIITQIIPVILGFKMIPLTSILTTITAVIIAYAIVKHKLMATGSFLIYRKLVASFLIVIVLVLNVGFFSVVQSHESLEKSIGEGSALSISETMDKIQRAIYNRVEEFQLQVDYHNHGFQELVKKSNQEFNALGSEQDIYAYINKKDMEWVSTPKNETTSFMEDLLDNNMSRSLNKKIEFYRGKYNYSLFGKIFVTNKYGANIGQTKRTSDYYQADEEWWQNGREDGLHIENVGYDESAEVYSIDLIVEIDDENGDFIGILKAVWNIEEIALILQDSKFSEENKKYESMCCSLLDSGGKLVYSTEEFEFLEDKSDKLSSFFEHHGEECNYFTIRDSNFGEGEKFVAYAYLESIMDFESLDWVLLIEYDTWEIFASVYNLWNTILVTSCIIVIISLLFSYIISRSISTPIIKLRNAAEEIGRGKLNTEINVKSNDEVGYLAFAFSEMASNLKKQQETLEEAVDKRTRELKQSKNALANNVERLEKNKFAMSHLMRDLNKTVNTLKESEKEVIIKNKELQMMNDELNVMHEQLNILNQDLEARVQERTAQVEKLLTQKDEFINQLGHDLKTPLTPLVLLTPLLRKHLDGKPEILKIADTLESSTNHMKNMVDKTLKLARLNSSKVTFEFEETNLLTEIKNAIGNNQFLFNENNIDVKNMVDEEIIVQADKSQLEEVFTNLFTNAIKYAQENKGSIVIDAEKGKDDEVIISVKDDGIGMTSEQQKFVFDEFYKLDSSRHDLDSSGLGLAICKRIVEHHGGRIWVESPGPGKGCTFCFTLTIINNNSEFS